MKLRPVVSLCSELRAASGKSSQCYLDVHHIFNKRARQRKLRAASFPTGLVRRKRACRRSPLAVTHPKAGKRLGETNHAAKDPIETSEARSVEEK